jgi:hypothetical protein
MYAQVNALSGDFASALTIWPLKPHTMTSNWPP